jgi:Prolyl oligopeptidase family
VLHAPTITHPAATFKATRVRQCVLRQIAQWPDSRGIPGRFLYFPDENHWILKPQNARLWYGTVLSFLDEHLNGVPFARDALL